MKITELNHIPMINIKGILRFNEFRLVFQNSDLFILLNISNESLGFFLCLDYKNVKAEDWIFLSSIYLAHDNNNS